MRAAIVLAGGGSRRFGRANKLVALLGGRPLLLHALENARQAGVGRIIVVVPSRGGRLGRLVRGCGLPMIVARHHREGMGATLAAGLAALRPIDRQVLIFLADMPFARAPRRMHLIPGKDAVRPRAGGKPGHPLLVRTAVAQAAGPRGDRGLAALIPAARIHDVRGRSGNLFDVDTPAKMRTARRSVAADCRSPR